MADLRDGANLPVLDGAGFTITDNDITVRDGAGLPLLDGAGLEVTDLAAPVGPVAIIAFTEGNDTAAATVALANNPTLYIEIVEGDDTATAEAEVDVPPVVLPPPITGIPYRAPDRFDYLRHLTVEVRDANLGIVVPLDEFTSLRFTETWMRVGGWVIELNPYTAAVAHLLTPGAGIVVRDGEGTVVYSGPVGVGSNNQPTAHRTYSNTDGRLVDTLVISGTDDMIHLANRIALPNPNGPTDAAYDVRYGPASTVMLAYIDANAGPSAQPQRRTRGLTFGPDPGVGGDVRGAARHANLLDFLGTLTVNLGVRVRYADGGKLAVSAHEVRDLTRDCVFSLELGNLDGFDYDQSPSTANAVYVAGQGEGTARVIAERAAQAVWRVETFVDRRDVADPLALGTAADLALVDAIGKSSITITPTTDVHPLYGVDFRLGDIVTAVIDDVQVADRVATVETSIDRDGVVRSFTLGSTAPVGVSELFAGLRRISQRVSLLERI